MAGETSTSGTFSARPRFDLYLYFGRNLTDAANNRSNYYFSVWARKISGSAAWHLDASPWNVSIGGQGFSGSAALDFRSTSSIKMGEGITGWFTHTPDGYLNLWGDASMSDSEFGSAYCGVILYADRIPKPPTAPSIAGLGVDQVGTTSMRYRFASMGDGGSPVTDWQVQYSTDPTFATGTIVSSGGSSILSPLAPGRRYYVRSRGVNAYGTGQWSEITSGQTLSGMFVGFSGSFFGAEVLVGKAGAFVTAEVLVGKNDVFVTAG